MDISPDALVEALRFDLERAHGPDFGEYLGPLSFTLGAENDLVAAVFLMRSILKKYRGEAKDRKAADRRAFALFEQWNQRCKDWVPPTPDNDVDRQLVGEFQACFLRCFELPNGELIDFSDAVPAEFRTGPGASVGVRVTDAYTKLYAGDLSTTSDDLYWHYYASTLPFSTQLSAELFRSESFRTPVVKGSLLGFAPKNSEISRTRCTEPSLNMVYQLGTGAVLEGVLRQRFGIDLSSQPRCNNELSRLGSKHGTYGTTDMSSASDATSLKFWRWAMPYDDIHFWFTWIRSPMTAHPFDKGAWIELNLLSSMGNGYTFPLMTLIFSCAVEAVYRTLGIELVKNRLMPNGDLKPGNFGVFGDDIIVLTEAFPLVNHLLELLGYAVNADKSFGAGPFRESCGTDWFHGHNVRGVYCKDLSTPQKRYALINHLNAWSAEWNTPLPATIRLLLRWTWYLPVPPWENADSGVIVPFDVFRSQRVIDEADMYYKGYRPIRLAWKPQLGLTVSHILKKQRGNLKPMRDYDFGSAIPPYVNNDGLLIMAARGALKGGEILVRGDPDKPRYRKSRLRAPGWAFDGVSSVGFSRTGWARFEKTLASINLGRF